jgi:hypothetical protein
VKRFGEQIHPAIILFIVEIFIFISRIIEDSLQNCQNPWIEIFDFQIDVFFTRNFLSFFPLSPAKFFGTNLLLNLDNRRDIRGTQITEYAFQHCSFPKFKNKEEYESLVYRSCTIALQ